ncbi:tyrosine-type recombinase/integrase [Mycobacterium sp. pW045]|uniref:tyrosine-type recombinase/integrase n=1 Tax=Mycobacterium sp. pW045 TaxID=3238984 RepID=UPI00351B71E6
MSGKEGRRGWGWIRKRSSGRYQASYVGPDNMRHFAPNTFERKMDAEEWLANERRGIETAIAQVRSGKTPRLDWVSPKQRELAIAAMLEQDKTLEEYAKQWIAQRNLKPRTTIQYTTLLEKHIAPKLGNVLVRQLNSATVRNWYATTLKDRPTYRSHAYQLLHAICKTAVADDLLDKNPCMIEGATSVKAKRQAVVPTVAQLAIIADKIEPKFKALVLISAWCGLRFGEVIELRRKDISDDCEVITVARGVTHRAGETRCIISTPKSGKGRTVIVPKLFRDDIQSHLDTYVGPDPDAQLFVPVRGGCHVSDRVVRDAFRLACDAAGITGMRIHDMRHFAGHQTARVANLPETMKRLGHSTSTASLRYQGQVSGRDVEIAAALSALANVPELPDDSTAAETANALEKQAV